MRPEELEKVEPVVYCLNGQIYHCAKFDSDNQVRIDSLVKRQEIHAITEIQRMQREYNIKLDGYYISRGVVYKVFFSNSEVKKITGNEARNLKRKIKLEARN